MIARLSHYRFRSQWRVPAPVDVVYDVLRDVQSYPQWWRQVETVDRIDENTSALVCRSVLPYRLRFRTFAARQDLEAGVLEARLTGDLHGWSRWTLTSTASGTLLTFDEEVVTTTRLLRWLAPVARPVLRLNHTLMMRSGEHGLVRRFG